MSDELLAVEGLRVASRIGGRERTIVESLSLSVAAGETVGIVGESGSGKSVTARAIMGLLPTGLHAEGHVRYRGDELLGAGERTMRRIRGAEIGLVFQDPFTMLSPLRRCGRHIDELLRDESGRRLSRAARRREAERRLAEVGIDDPDVVDRRPFQLSGGMRQRVGIAAALARDPRLLIADEPSTALDVTTQREILALLKSLQRSRGMGLIMITHDLRVAFAMCDRIHVMYAGALLELAPAAAIEAEPRHPYTLGLLLSEPSVERRVAELSSIPGSVPKADEVRGRCAFAPRCDWAAEACLLGPTPLRALPDGALTACVRAEDIREDMRARRQMARAPVAPAPARTDVPLLLRCADVTKTFGTVHALRGVSIEVAAGESVGLVGESGSGKTTLGRCVVGLEVPTSGTVERLAPTQIVFQDPYSSLNPARTIGSALREAIAVGDGRRAATKRGVEALLERVGLPPDYAPRKPVALSGGERQRVAIARALAARPQLVVCDEPVSALDVSVQAQILNLFARLRDQEGIGFLFITHDLAVARQMVDRAYVMYRGEVLEQGAVDAVLDAPGHDYTRRLVASIPRSAPDWLPTPAA